MGIVTDDMKRIVREQRLGYIATVCPDGTPNLSPKATTAVWGHDDLVFADILSGTARSTRIKTTARISMVSPLSRYIWHPRWKISSERWTSPAP
jgi:predicted pyridoxine 5'-phosphate oxidase superfamily flavin-nucleotide-binding protein